MKLRVICAIGGIFLLAANIYSLLNNIFWLGILSHIGFYMLTFFLFFSKRKFYTIFYYSFLVLTFLSYGLRIFSEYWFFNELSLLLQAISYLALIMEATKHFKVKHASSFMLVYFFSVIGLNTYLILLHIFEMKSYISSNGTFIVYAFYYLNLGALGIVAFVYYLNSYSRKSMFFITLVITLIFADILRDMGVFYFKDISVEICESIIRIGSALFLTLFFITKEKRLHLSNLI